MADFPNEQKAFEVADTLIADSESAFGHPHKEEEHPKFPVLNRYYFVYTTVTKRKIKETEERFHQAEADVGKKQKWEGFEGLDDAGDAAAAGSADVKPEDEAFTKLQHALQDTRHSSSFMCRPQRREYF